MKEERAGCGQKLLSRGSGLIVATKEDRRAKNGFSRSGSKESVGFGNSLADPIPRKITSVQVSLVAAAASVTISLSLHHQLQEPQAYFQGKTKEAVTQMQGRGWLTHIEGGIQGITILDAILSKLFG